MIYPEKFPEHRFNEYAEKRVYDAMRNLSKDFDVFYNRKFVSVSVEEKPEYEIDFIIADLRKGNCNGIICLEVKGGELHCDHDGNWFQNRKPIKESPDNQVSSSMRSLMKRYPDFSKDVPFGWMLCFPDGRGPDQGFYPTNLSPLQIIDASSLMFINDMLIAYFDRIRQLYSIRKGVHLWKYETFKASLLINIGFILPLYDKIVNDEKTFIKLTSHQVQAFHNIMGNEKVLVKGIAGSGKTIIAKTIAQEFAEQGKRVLFLCYNRILGNNIRHSLRHITRIEVSNYHSYARKRIGETTPGWWEKHKDSQEFWDLEVPAKFDEIKDLLKPDYDAIIIDEGQDFRELWFETILYFLKPRGKFYVFMDELQNIFETYTTIPGIEDLVRYGLEENCRNTRRIVTKLEEYIRQKIKPKDGLPEGEPVIIKYYSNDTEQQTLILREIKALIKEKGIKPRQILLMFNADKRSSCLANTNHIGNYELISLKQATGETDDDAIYYTSIKTFKGLEADIVFIIDTDKASKNDNVLYTQASRAKHLLYVFLKK